LKKHQCFKIPLPNKIVGELDELITDIVKLRIEEMGIPISLFFLKAEKFSVLVFSISYYSDIPDIPETKHGCRYQTERLC
jgi:hypothetical protein